MLWIGFCLLGILKLEMNNYLFLFLKLFVGLFSNFFNYKLFSINWFYRNFLNFDTRPGGLNLVALENIVLLATRCIFSVQPPTGTWLFWHVLFCFIKVLYYFVNFFIGWRTIVMYGYPNKSSLMLLYKIRLILLMTLRTKAICIIFIAMIIRK